MTVKKSMVVIALLIGLIIIIIGFVLLNVEIFNRLTLIDAKCERRVGEGDFIPDNFQFIEQELDTTPYLMQTYEEVTFPSRDGINISGFFIPASVSSISETETVIIVHGFNDCKHRPFSLLPAGMLHRNDINALVIDLRNHGNSEVTNGRMTGGSDEALDVLGAWDWLINEKGIPAEKIGVFGYSLGGATIINAMSIEPQIVAGWSNSAFDTIDRILQQELQKEGFPTWLSTPALHFGRLTTGVDLISITPEQVISQLDGRPLFIVHSIDDDVTPVASASVLLQAGNREEDESTVWYPEGPPHINEMTDFPEIYEERLINFFRLHLNSEN